MWRTAAIAVGAFAVACANAKHIDGVVQLDIVRQPVPRLRKRTAAVLEDIQNQESLGGYFAKTQIGNPPQTVTLQLDTGSSDVWVPSSSSEVCRQTNQGSSSSQCILGSFTSSKSKSFVDLGAKTFSIAYVDGSHSNGDYFSDSFEIGGLTLSNLTMGLGLDTDIPYGLAGIGYASNEASVANSGASQPYANLPVAMMNEGVINSVAFSLWLNDLDASTGNILFGGIDTAKYKGTLSRVDVLPTSGVFTSFNVALTSLQAVSSSGSDTLSSSDFPITVILDSGTTLSYLPTDLAEQVWSEAGAVYEPSLGMALIPCSMSTSTGYFSFGFSGEGGPQIDVPMNELVVDLTQGNAPTFGSGAYNGLSACEFGIQNFSSAPYLLGDTFLRSAYVVYDLMNNQIALAQTDFNATQSNVVPFPSASAAIPSSIAASSGDIAANSQPSSTAGGMSASAGFSDNVSGNTKNGAVSTRRPFDSAQVAVVALAMVLSLFGSGIFCALQVA